MIRNSIQIRSLAMTLAMLFSCGFATSSLGGPVTSFDDIQFWVGNGSNRSAMAIDWDDVSASDEALVWGYRWDGAATGEDMLQAVLEADSRLFAKQSTSGTLGIALYGLGYDLDNDSVFGITDGTVFDSNGIAVSGPPDNPPQTAATATDPEDLYAEGWFTGFWHYGQSIGGVSPFDGGSWDDSDFGMSRRSLADGDWDSWTFTPTFNFNAFAENPFAAEPPLADFDSDSDVDGADFLIWQRGYGILSGATLAQGDATGDGAVDHFDLGLWSAQYGNSTLPIAVCVVPEPNNSAAVLFVSVVLFFTPRSVQRTNT